MGFIMQVLATLCGIAGAISFADGAFMSSEESDVYFGVGLIVTSLLCFCISVALQSLKSIKEALAKDA